MEPNPCVGTPSEPEVHDKCTHSDHTRPYLPKALQKMIYRPDRYFDMFGCCTEFTKLYLAKTGKQVNGTINREFITKMVMDELQELREAKDQAEEIDALLDAVYYILQHLATLNIDIRPIWYMIHLANMTKFEKGHLGPDGKWIKPVDFQAPDDDIREYLKNNKT